MDDFLAVPGIDATSLAIFGFNVNEAIMRAAKKGDMAEMTLLLAVRGSNGSRAINMAIEHGLWHVLEILLAHPTAMINNSSTTSLSPIERHAQALQLCTKPTHQSQIREVLRKAYELAYREVWVENEGEFHVGVSELVSEYVVGSRILAEWTVLVQRKIRNELNKLKTMRVPAAPATNQPRDITSIGCVMMHQLPVFEQPTRCFSMAAFKGLLYLPNYDHRAVHVVDAATGARMGQWGTFNQLGQSVIGQPPRFQSPYGVVLDHRRNRLYISDSSNHCVVAVRLCDGIVDAVWGSFGSGPEQFQVPCSLAYDSSTDQIYVADCHNHCVKVLQAWDGQCVQVLQDAPAGYFGNRMNRPEGVVVDGRHIYIADTRNERVLVYSKQSREFLFRFQDSGSSSSSSNIRCRGMCGMSVDNEAGVVYVADQFNHRVCVYKSGDGSYIREFGVGLNNNSKAKPVGVLWDDTGVLYITFVESTTIFVNKC